MKRIGLFVQLPLAYNFRKQIVLFGDLLSDSYEIDVVGPTGAARFGDYDLEQLRDSAKLNSWLMNNLVLFFTGYRYLRKFRPDTLMTIGDLITVAPLAVSLGRLCHIPVIIRLGGDVFVRYKFAKWWQKIPLYFLRNVVGRMSLKFADKIIVMGPNEKEGLTKMGFSEGKIVIIPPIIDKDGFRPPADKNESKKKLGLPISPRVVLFVGKVQKAKGAHILKRVAEEVGSQSKDIVFCVVGEGEYKERLRELENVKTAGSVELAEMHKYYEAADLLILPSLSEGLPNVILEALTCKVPVVANNVGEISWVVSNICQGWRDFADFILNGDWKLDTLPEIFSPEESRRAFEGVFDSISEKV